MDKKEILDILDNAKDERGAVPMRLVRQAFDKLPTIQPEKAQLSQEGTTSDAISRQEELLDDGTLVVWTNTDMSKFSRVNVRQIGTHYGDLFYPDGD